MFRRKPKPVGAPPSPGPGLRAQALALDPAAVGLTRDASGPVWGVMMDTTQATAGGWHCLVALADGTTSLYTSSAFGIIGGGAHEPVRVANHALLAVVAQHLDGFVPAPGNELPPAGSVTIRALTFDGQLTATATEADLVGHRHPASPAFRAAHGVITQLRLVTRAG